MKKIAIVVATLFIVSGCSMFGGQPSEEKAAAGGSPEVEAAIKEAEAAIKKADSAGGEWRDTSSKILKDAKAAAAKGDNKTALKLAKEAKFEGEMGYQQAKEQEKASPWLF
ncbi:MAG: SoxXA-binding protein [Gammaproteobacteria bacterium]|nr:SoxXA-binding protein [Gammaproteobacteria bacterium]